MKSKKIKLFFKDLSLVVLFVCLCYSFKIITVYAAQGPAYNFMLSLSGPVSFDDTSLEVKSSTDSCAMKCTWAEDDSTRYYAYACNYNGDYSLNTELFYEGTWALLNNTVYEHGFRRVMITAYVDGTCGVTNDGALFSGYWYADSGYY